VILSLCPPHAAVEVARPLTRFAGIYVDANAVSPMTAQMIAGLVRRYVDGGIIGAPPRESGTTRLYVSGSEAAVIAHLFANTILDVIVVSDNAGAASAVKMAYAAWTKGTSALLLAIRALAHANGIEETLLREWQTSQPDLPRSSAAAGRAALAKGWRWVGEMNEIADTFAAAGLPDGFHRAAADIYDRSPSESPAGDGSLEHVLLALLGSKTG
jgi:3-hydroxyisobutyrate dehydrogenase-like beta-hydroxyacid dehydrogenase